MATRQERDRDAWTTLVLVMVLLALLGAGGYGVMQFLRHRPQQAERGPMVPEQYKALVLRAGRTCRPVPPALIAAQLDAESGWTKDAVSPAGAQGIAQFTPDAWEQHGKDHNKDGKADPFDPADAIPSQAEYMCALAARMQRLREGGHVQGDLTSLTLAGYNAGPESVVKEHGVPKYTETLTYVARIKKLIPAYEAELAPRTSTTNR